MLVTCALAFASAGQAQTPPAPPPDAGADPELDRIFQQMLRDPANLDLMFLYAQTAVQRGNYDAAIGTLSRMLLFNPNLPRVRLELGALYFQMGSYAAARSYLDQALAAPDMPPDVRERATALLAEIDRRTARNKFAGNLSAGVRWQQNANSGPTDVNVRALGQDATLSNEFTGRSDWNAFALASFQHIYNPQIISDDVLESTAVFYGTRQNKQHDLNVALAEVTTGPRFGLGNSGPGNVTLRPYLLANIVGLGDAYYYHTFGAGIGLTQEFGERVLGEALFERREKRFNNTDVRPFATDQDGDENSLFLSARIRTSADTVASLGAGVSGDNAREPFRANVEWLGAATFSYFFDPELWAATQPWSVNFAVARLYTHYDAPDPAVDPNVTREDNEWRFTLFNTVPLTDSLSFVGQVQRFLVDSNLPNFKYNNWSVSAGLSWQF
jgi:tetratricopeptide (TPR) repeat protein